MTFASAMQAAIEGSRVPPVGVYWYVTHKPNRHFRVHRDGFVEDYRLQSDHVRAEWERVR